MPLYVVIASPQPAGETLSERIRSGFDESDRQEFRPGVWFVRSPLVTTAQLRDQLGIKVGGHSGIVVAAVSGRYTGVADGTFVEKLQVWEGME
jgi:hypothetical protein